MWLDMVAMTDQAISGALSLSFALCAIAVFVRALNTKQEEALLPPKPRGKWLLGNVDLVFAPRRWQLFSELSKTLGQFGMTRRGCFN